MAIATKKTIGARGSGKITSSATVTLKQIAAQLAERQDLLLCQIAVLRQAPRTCSSSGRRARVIRFNDFGVP
jgi:hypothetical protein